jgi:hypothetical protein
MHPQDLVVEVRAATPAASEDEVTAVLQMQGGIAGEANVSRS